MTTAAGRFTGWGTTMFSYLMPAEKDQSSQAADSLLTPGLQPSMSDPPPSPGRHAAGPAVIEQSRFALAQLSMCEVHLSSQRPDRLPVSHCPLACRDRNP